MDITLVRLNNMGHEGTGNQVLILRAPINHVTITAAFTGLLLSSDKGQTFISVPVGTHSFRVGITKQIRIQAEDAWQITLEQA